MTLTDYQRAATSIFLQEVERLDAMEYDVVIETAVQSTNLNALLRRAAHLVRELTSERGTADLTAPLPTGTGGTP